MFLQRLFGAAVLREAYLAHKSWRFVVRSCVVRGGIPIDNAPSRNSLSQSLVYEATFLPSPSVPHRTCPRYHSSPATLAPHSSPTHMLPSDIFLLLDCIYTIYGRVSLSIKHSLHSWLSGERQGIPRVSCPLSFPLSHHSFLCLFLEAEVRILR